ncbi:amino acid permease [Natranaeroarchaeum sulfidigenes]|uniref:Amino acid transporter n=1 Tax=Natranaeroarchaeum sulfidigenes TaxID=2784880 RepID=A0A897MMC2_9EURY|nr:amino acid permease [Natranaeroarchaeum sulfidigenes]QSG01542.1 Amino acid transporter [Natranaeroarchaeum sulfidigenes]
MPSSLKRDLGLAETTAIAVGAMIGSGIFILPGLAWFFADTAAVFAFVLAAILVLPAALAVAEMSTAIPEDGGPYLYVERSMGPLLGTIAGVGTWLMLSLKSALALVGGVPYLVYVNPTLAEFVTALAVVLAIFFTVVNLVSAEGSGKLQFGIVGILILILGWLVVGGIPEIDTAATAGAFDPTGEGILQATAIVFISYAGLTKVGAVAEEVEDPGRNLPLAIIGALAFVAVMYAAIVYITIGVLDIQAAIDAGQLGSDGEGPIIALVAEQAIGPAGAIAIVIAALMALASTANAGLLAASRFPLAMARDGVFPEQLEQVSERFATPFNAVALTGGVLLLMVTVLPIQQVAAFGSAFQILVFILLNVALIGFREGVVPEYDPAFETPLYPWMPIAGILGGSVVLVYTGIVAVAGALGIVALAALWYFGYVRYYSGGIDREGAARAQVRESAGSRAVEHTRELFESTREYDVLVAVTESTSDRARQDMTRIAADLGRLRSTVVTVVEFLDIPHYVFPERHAKVISDERPDWLPEDPTKAPEWYPSDDDPALRTSGGTRQGKAKGTDQPADVPEENGDVEIRYREIDSEDHEQAIVDYATYEEIDLILLERRAEERFQRLFGDRETERILRNAPCDVAVVEDRGFESPDEIAVVTARGAYDPVKLLIADAIAEETGAEISLLQTIPEDAPDTQRRTIEDYHNDLTSICTVPVTSRILETDEPLVGLQRFVGDADLVLTGVGRTGLAGRLFGQPEQQLVERLDCSVISVQAHESRRQGFIEQLVMEYVF